MLPIFPHKPIGRSMDDGPHAKGRSAKEQAFYECYGSTSIVGLFRVVLTIGELWNGPTTVLGWLSPGKVRQDPDARLRPR